MDPKSRKALSWSISIVVHATIAFFIARAAINFVLPEGEVDTSSTTIDVVGGSPQAVAIKSAPVHDQPSDENSSTTFKTKSKTKAPKTHVAVEKADEPPVHFIPDKDFNEIKPTEQDKDSDEMEREREQAKQGPELLPEKKSVTQNEDQAVEDTENETAQLPQAEPSPEAKKEVAEQPVPAPAPQQQLPAPPAVPAAPTKIAEQPATSLPAKTAHTNTGTLGGANGDIPAFGTPGTSLDISKLIELPGNQAPQYPTMAKLLHHQGTVYVRAYITRDGHVDLPILEKSSGSSFLDREAVTAFAHWRFQPGPSGWVVKPIIFRLKN